MPGDHVLSLFIYVKPCKLIGSSLCMTRLASSLSCQLVALLLGWLPLFRSPFLPSFGNSRCLFLGWLFSPEKPDNCYWPPPSRGRCCGCPFSGGTLVQSSLSVRCLHSVNSPGVPESGPAQVWSLQRANLRWKGRQLTSFMAEDECGGLLLKNS